MGRAICHWMVVCNGTNWVKVIILNTSAMKKQLLQTLVLMVFPLLVLPQAPTDTASIDTLPALHFKNGSVPYPSGDAYLLLGRVAKPVPRSHYSVQEVTFEDGQPSQDFFDWDVVHYQVVKKQHQQAKSKTPCDGVQILIGLTFLMLSVFDKDFHLDTYNWTIWP